MKYSVGDLLKVSYSVSSYKKHVWYLTSEDIVAAIALKNDDNSPFAQKKAKQCLTTLVRLNHYDDFYYLYKNEKIIESFFGIVAGFFTYKSEYEYETTTIIFFDVNEMKFVEINPIIWILTPLTRINDSALVV